MKIHSNFFKVGSTPARFTQFGAEGKLILDGIIKTIKEIKVYENEFIDVYDDIVSFPSGKVGTYFRSRWRAPYGVAILPVINNTALLVKNYRYSEKAFSYEVPQGFGSKDSTPFDDALRELSEETGLKPNSIQSYGTVGHDFVTHLFLAIISDSKELSTEHKEDTEAISGFHYFNLKEIVDEEKSKFIYDQNTKILIQKYCLRNYSNIFG
ncbi:NUDIX hydrolase [Cohaesibacter haloalkalitolerans]|uniref:NUDIX hydrolase n=1 Tax=Cohaesibacter haloalkalitolerans TaxID=1162980 RepID=UPI000E64B95D|nr:NUDIX domain-containing protein [Cohaesibacter haloalkalitolerans]